MAGCFSMLFVLYFFTAMLLFQTSYFNSFPKGMGFVCLLVAFEEKKLRLLPTRTLWATSGFEMSLLKTLVTSQFLSTNLQI